MSEPKHPTIEILSFTASEALLNDESLLNPVLDTVLKAQGARRIYIGSCFDEGETNVRYLFILWDDFEAHKRLMDDNTRFSQVLEDFAKCCDGEPTQYHVPSSDDTSMVFTAPVTEIARVLVKGPGGEPELHQLFADWAQAATCAPLAKEYQPFVFGQSLEKSDVYFMLGGWATKDHHLDCIDTELQKEIGLLADQTAHLKVNHCTMKEYGLGGQYC